MEDLSEKEQLEALRAWWAENGNSVIGGMVLGIVVIFGRNRWQSNIARTEIAASTLFEDVMDAASLDNIDNGTFAANDLFENYATSPYAAHARLAMARLYMDNNSGKPTNDNPWFNSYIPHPFGFYSDFDPSGRFIVILAPATDFPPIFSGIHAPTGQMAQI